MKHISRKALAETVVRQITEGQPRKRVLQRLAAYVVEHRMARQIDALLNDIALEVQAQTGHAVADVRTAHEINASVREELEHYIKRATGAKSVELQVSQDPNLLGGFVLRTPDKEIDTSLRRKLNQLARGGV